MTYFGISFSHKSGVYWVRDNPNNTLCHFFRILNLVIFEAKILSKYIDSGYLVCSTPSTILCRSFSNFKGILVMHLRCACSLDITLRLFLSLVSPFALSQI